MITAVVVAAAAICLFAATGPMLARALQPRVAVWLLNPALVIVAGAGVFVLAVITALWLGQLGEVAEYGAWSPTALAAHDPIRREVSIAAGLVLVPACLWTLRTAVRHVRQLIACYAAERDLPARRDPDNVSIIDSLHVDALTLPSGRIIITQGLLSALSAQQRAIVIAHERSHRRHRHTWWNLCADLASALNPLLRPAAHAVCAAAERWADEDATRVADRRTVATTIAHIALLRHHTAQTAAAGAAGGRIPQRVAALLQPPPRTRLAHVAATAAIVATVLLASTAVQQRAERVFETAMTTCATAGHHPPPARHPQLPPPSCPPRR